MTPDISIVMPTFGQSKYITESLQSIVAQEFENWELVVVIDGEDTETEKILKLWTANNDRIKYITKLNGGTGSALNYGFFQTGGRYETWFASDNKMYPNCLRVLISHLRNNLDIGLAYGNEDIGYMDAEGTTEVERKSLTDVLDIDQTWNIQKTLQNFYFGICWLWRKDVRLLCGSFQTEPSEDYDMFLRMQEVTKFAYVPTTLGWYRQHNQNMTQKIAKTSKTPDYYMKFVTEKARLRRPDLYEKK